MDLNFTETQLILRKTAREFCELECPPSLVRAMETHPEGHSVELWHKIVQMGWLGVFVPAEYGGHGGGFLDLLILLHEMGRSALPGPFFATTVFGGTAIMEGGSIEQKRELLPRLADGQLLITIALSEPGIDFGLDHLNTAVVQRNGHHFVTGTKVFVPNAHISDLLLCITAGTGLSSQVENEVVLVGRTDPGVTLTAIRTNLPDRQFEVALTDVRARYRLGNGEDARPWMQRVLEKAMVAKCAEMIGAGQKLLEMTVEHAKVRVQFDRPIGSLQAVQHHCANIAVCLDTAELMTYRAGWNIEQRLPCRREALRAKAWTNEACNQVAALAHQIHGGTGFMREHDLHIFSRQLLTSAHLFGGTGWCRRQIAREIGLPM
ncbi:MAG TPA: acyl-CoA dehydrogenase family protein [Candidatus Binataceae bacterium]|nr:acyl-CoA dehydrogenase family protein [Candidatus Binataceae bacterium]